MATTSMTYLIRNTCRVNGVNLAGDPACNFLIQFVGDIDESNANAGSLFIIHRNVCYYVWLGTASLFLYVSLR